MSMISSLIDELRKSADEWNGSNMFELARMCSDAADTIWELRDDLQRANAENAKLREERDKMDVWHSKELSATMAENAKLRELCKDMMAFVEDDDACERCGHDAECVEAADGELVLPYEGQCLMLDLFADRMRELGIEVDG